MPFLTANNINKSYHVGTQRLHVLRDLDLAVEQGEMVAVVGASGVGKSTLLHLLGGLDRADSGTITVGDNDIVAMPDDSADGFSQPARGVRVSVSSSPSGIYGARERRDAVAHRADQPGRVETAGRGRTPTSWTGRSARAPPQHAVGWRTAAGGGGPCVGHRTIGASGG